MLKTREGNSCTEVISEGDSIDILCTLPTDKCSGNSTAFITWVFSSTIYRVEIKDNEKYGKLNSLTTW